MGKVIYKVCSLKINVLLLAIAIVFAAISSLSDKEALRCICLAIGWILALRAVVPSLFRFMWEVLTKGKARDEDPNKIIPEWKKFCQSMGITKDIKTKVFPNLRNAYAKDSTIEIGQPILDTFDSASKKAMLAHELAHIKENPAFKFLYFCIVIAVFFVLLAVLYQFTPLGSSSYSSFCPSLLLLIGFTGIAFRFITWPFEYKADLVAKQYVRRKAVVSCLKSLASIRKMDCGQDFYSHPSIAKRVANLDWTKKTRFKKWYFEL